MTRQSGFTLIELVVTLVISAIVVSFVSVFISGPVRGFMDQARRARLVDAADSALQRIGRDVRRALPNSVRTTSAGGVVALEVLSTVDGGRYRAQPPGTAAQVLDFAGADGSFNVLGPFTQIVKPFTRLTAIENVMVASLPRHATHKGARLEAGQEIKQALPAGRHAWVQVARGAVDLNGTALAQGDGAALSDERALEIRAGEDAEILVFDLG